MTERLYGGAEVAGMLGVWPSAVSNWLARGTGPLPEPAYRYGKRPLWTAAQLAPIIAAKAAELNTLLEELDA